MMIIDVVEAAAPSSSPVNPEAMTILVNAVTAAQYSAQISAVLSVVTLISVLILGMTIAWLAYNFVGLKHQTNSIMDALLKVTKDEALARGVKQGRAEMKEEEEEED